MKKWLVPALLVAGLTSGCSGDLSLFGDDEPSATPSNATSTPEAQSGSDIELRFVNPTAPACSLVWVAGQRLPVSYEWCVGDDGAPVAGPRIGSCEVVSYAGTLYAVPGYRIRVAQGAMAQDPAFQRMLTSCKRDPQPAG